MRRFDDFCRALRNLQEIRGKEPPYDTITQTGMVSLFEICFEQAWKAMKEALGIIRDAKKRYLPLFETLEKELQEGWS